jgi:hypothetical protein
MNRLAASRQVFRINALCLFAMVVVQGNVNASSVWCEPPHGEPQAWAKDSLDSADAVFLGRVVSIDEIPQDEPQQANDSDASTMAELLQRIEASQELANTQYDHVVSFEVIKSWKDPIYPIVRTRVMLGMFRDARAFREDESYLVRARDEEDAIYRIANRCHDAILQEWADEYIEALELAVK